MLQRLFRWTGFFESNLSAADWAWRIATFLVIAGGGTTAGLLARGTELFREAGLLAWFAIGLAAAFFIALIFLFVKIGHQQSAEASYMQSLAQVRSRVNPLSDSFSDLVISLPDLYLPRLQVHSNKQFKRCKLVGPGAIALMGGSFIKSTFSETGSVIVIPEKTMLTGVLVLDNCTVEYCEFIGITLLTGKDGAEHFKKMGASVVGA